MRIHVGTSGFSYKEWKGSFYPETLGAPGWLGYYAERLSTVEINNTFYRMPSRKVLSGWADAVGADFAFAVKASRRITHFKRLQHVEDELDYLFGNLEILGGRLGVVLFQLPPNLECDVERLRDFLMQLPRGRRVALEFRHPSWFTAEVRAALADAGVAQVVNDDEDEAGAPPALDAETPATAPFGYLRLRRDAYTPAALAAWLERIREQPWEDAFVYFKHEETAPQLALDFRSLTRPD